MPQWLGAVSPEGYRANAYRRSRFGSGARSVESGKLIVGLSRTAAESSRTHMSGFAAEFCSKGRPLWDQLHLRKRPPAFAVGLDPGRGLHLDPRAAAAGAIEAERRFETTPSGDEPRSEAARNRQAAREVPSSRDRRSHRWPTRSRPCAQAKPETRSCGDRSRQRDRIDPVEARRAACDQDGDARRDATPRARRQADRIDEAATGGRAPINATARHGSRATAPQVRPSNQFGQSKSSADIN